MAHFWLFLWLVLQHFVLILSGCVLTAILGLIEKLVLRRQVSVKVYAVILVGFIFVACFLAWHEGFLAEQKAQAESNRISLMNSDLKARIDAKQDLIDKLLARQKQVELSPGETVKRERIREQLGNFLIEGENLKLRCTHSDMGAAPTREEAISWAKGVNDYLRKNLDKSYSARFLTNRDRMLPVAPVGLKPEIEGIWFGINSQTSALSDFIKELK